MAKKLLLRVALDAIFVLCLTAGGLFGVLRLLSTGPGEKALLFVAQNQLGKSFNQIFRAKRIETDLFSYLTVYDLHVAQKVGSDTLALGKVGVAHIRLNLWRIYRGDIRISQIDLTKANVSASSDSGGTVFFPFVRNRRGGSSSWLKWHIGQIRFSQSRLGFTTPGWNAKLENVRGMADFGDTGRTGFQVASDSGLLRVDKRVLGFSLLSTEGVWEGSAVRFDRSSLVYLGASLSGSGLINYGSTTDSVKASVSSEINLKSMADRFLPKLGPQYRPVSGTAKVNALIFGELSRPTVRFTGKSENARAGKWGITRGLFQGKWDWDTLSIDSFSLHLLSGNIRGAAKVSASHGGGYLLHADFRGIDPAEIMGRVGVSRFPYRTRMAGRIASQGHFDHLSSARVDLTIRTGAVSDGNGGLGGLRVAATLRGSRLHLEFSRPGMKGEADVGLTGEKIAGSYAAEIENLAAITKAFNLGPVFGRLRSRGELSGTLKDPRIAGRVGSDSMSFGGIPFSHVDGRFRYSKKAGIRVLALNLRGETDSLGRIAYIGGIGLKGFAQYWVRVSGKTGQWQGNGQIQLREIEYRSLRFAHAKAIVGLSKTKLTVLFDLLQSPLFVHGSGSYDYFLKTGNAALSVYKNNGDVLPELQSGYGEHSGEIGLNVDLKKPLRIEGFAGGVDLALFAAVSAQLASMAGRMDLTFTISNPWSDPAGSAQFRILSPGYKQIRADSLTGALQARNRLLRATARLRGGPHSASFEGGVGLVGATGIRFSRTSRVFGSAVGQEFPISMFMPLLPQGMMIEGKTSYDLRWDGSIGDPNIKGDIHLTQGGWRLSEKTLPVRGISIDLTVRDSLIQVEHFRAAIADMPVTLQGSAALVQWPLGKINLAGTIAHTGRIRIQGFVNRDSLQIWSQIHGVQLAVLRPFLPAIRELSGKIDSDLRVVGPLKKPWSQGIIMLDSVNTLVGSFREPLRQGSAKIRFLGRRLTVENSRALWGGGSIEISGTVEYGAHGNTKVDFVGRVRGIRITLPDTLRLGINAAQFTLRNAGPDFALNGNIHLADTRILLDFNPESVLPITQEVEKVASDTSQWRSRVRMDLRVEGNDSLWIDNNVAKTRMQPEIEIGGSMSAPQVTGRVTAVEGSLFFLDREFALVRGAADFVSPRRLNPILDVLAEATVPIFNTSGVDTFYVTLSISGPLDRATVELTSQPPLSRSDIFALLTLGTTATFDSTSTITATDLLLGRAAEIAGQRLIGYVGSRLGLERLTLRGNLLAAGLGNIQLIAAKRFGNRMEVIYAADIGEFGRGEIRIAYRLTSKFSLEGDTDQEGRAGVDIKYGVQFE